VNDDQSQTEDDDGPPNRARSETLAIPKSLRQAVDERDQQHCRVCGQYLGQARAMHHIRFGGARQGMGGRREHDLNNLISVCWMWPGNCHDRVHAQKRLWLPLLERLTITPGVTGMQLMRWQHSRRRITP
jgi:hypothetical protein